MTIHRLGGGIRRWAAGVSWRLAAGQSRLAAELTGMYGIDVGEGSMIHPPRRIDGARFISVGSKSSIGPGAWLGVFGAGDDEAEPRLTIGDGVYIGHFACITAIRHVRIGHRCVLSEFVYISDHRHGFDPEAGHIAWQPLVTKGGVEIGSDTFIGYQACIMPGVTLGQHCVVGANSVVTRSFPGYAMVAGAPARLIKRYSPEQHTWIAVSDEG